jgi:branched-chain amino acid transport system substrate-binding protein
MRILKLLFPALLLNTLQVHSVNILLYPLQHQLKSDTIKIGILIQDNKSLAARQGAELAIRKANKTGGLNGRPFAAVVRSMEGPWGTGSKEAVDLIFDEKVVAIMGSHDGRNAHLVEQVCAKARVVFLSAWTGDPTLSQAFVPWYFSCVPNDLQQADILVEEIYNNRKFNGIATISDSSYDSKMAETGFLKKVKAAGKKEPIRYFYDVNNQNLNNLPDQINKTDVQCIVLFGQSSESLKLIKLIRQKKIEQTIFGTLSILGEKGLSDQELKDFDNVVLISSGDMLNTRRLVFIGEFEKTYGYQPGPAAEYSFDAMNLLIEAIRSGGTERELIQKYFAKIQYKGATGSFSFDSRGNRLGVIKLEEVKNGHLITVKKK